MNCVSNSNFWVKNCHLFCRIYCTICTMVLILVFIHLRLFSQHPTINDELPNCILLGTVQVKPNIEFKDPVWSFRMAVLLRMSILWLVFAPTNSTSFCVLWYVSNNSISCRFSPQGTSSPIRFWPHMWSQYLKTRPNCTSTCFLLS